MAPSHYLFVYSDLIGEDEHLKSVVEMCRVAREVRIFGLLKMFDGGRSPYLEPVVRELQQRGFDTEVGRVGYEFLRGANEMLRICRRGE